jgi:hypothetical protein
MHHIQVFVSLKALVFKCAEKDGSVDTELLLSLADQVVLRTNMLMIAVKYMPYDIGIN